MPALVCLGMKWRTGSDDFVACGVVFAAVSFIVGLLGIIYTTTTTTSLVIDTTGDNSSVTVQPCSVIVFLNESDTSVSPRPTELIGGLEDHFMVLLKVQSCIFLAVGASYALLAICSSIGTIMEPKRREPAVPILLTVTSALSIGLLAVGSALAKKIYVDDGLSMCTILETVGGFHSSQVYYIAHALVGFGIAEFSLLFVFLCMAIDGSRGKELADRDSYHALWLFRMKIMCFCFGWRTADRNNKNNKNTNTTEGGVRAAGGVLNGLGHRGAAISGFDAFTDAADALAVLFKGLDLVPSDIVAGLLLLQGIQERRHRRDVATKVCYKSVRNPGGLALHRTMDGNFAEPPLSSMEGIGGRHQSSKLVPVCGSFDRVSRQAQNFTGLTPELVADLRLIERYSNYFLGAYGWKLYIFGRILSGLPKLCAHDPCFCCGGYVGAGRMTDCCGCDANAMMKYTGLTQDEVLFTSFKNEVFLPAFYVALEHIHHPASGGGNGISVARNESRKAAQTLSSVRGGEEGAARNPQQQHAGALGNSKEDFEPSMCVTDDEDRAVVIAIRGSMSLEDCVTDANAVPAPLAQVGEGYTGPLPAYCHGGMLRCAERIIAELEINGVLADLVGNCNHHHDHNSREVDDTAASYSPAAHQGQQQEPLSSSSGNAVRTRAIDTANLSKRTVVVLGHSLGAGTAIIVSIVLRQRYPSLIPRLKCIAYAPPGGLLSAELSAYTRSFCVGTFMGHDVIPRLALHTLTELRSSMLHALAASKQGKAAVLCQFLCPTRTETLAEEDELSTHTYTAHTKLLAQEIALGGTCLEERSTNLEETATPSPSSEATISSPTQPSHPADLLMSKKLYPPHNLVHFVKAVSVSYSALGGTCTCNGSATMMCGSCCCPREDIYYPVYITPGNIQEIICSPFMGLDHLPDRFYDTMHDCFMRLRRQHLDELVGGSTAAQQQQQATMSTPPPPLPVSAGSATGGVGARRGSSSQQEAHISPPTPLIFRHQSLTRMEAATTAVVKSNKLSDVVVRRPPGGGANSITTPTAASPPAATQ